MSVFCSTNTTTFRTSLLSSVIYFEQKDEANGHYYLAQSLGRFGNMTQFCYYGIQQSSTVSVATLFTTDEIV
jgi:hypothetical protein